MEEMRSPQKLADVERKHILETLVACEGNRTHTALCLGISIRCLRNKLRLYIVEGQFHSPTLEEAAKPQDTNKRKNRPQNK